MPDNETENSKNETNVTYSNIVYYDPDHRQKNEDEEICHCQQFQEGDLIIDENTIYEIDEDCYRHLQKKRAKRTSLPKIY